MIETSRTRLRRFTLDDLDALHALESDPEVVPATGFRTPQTRDQSAARLERILTADPGPHPLGYWGAFDRTGSLVVWLMLLRARFGPTPELGFMVPRAAWGRGLATEACRGLLEAAAAAGIAHVAAVTDEENGASQRVLAKLGFRRSPDSVSTHDGLLFELDVTR